MTHEELKAIVADLVGNADANNGPEWRDGLTRKELAGDMIAYADDAFSINDETDLDELERIIVLALKELNIGIDDTPS